MTGEDNRVRVIGCARVMQPVGQLGGLNARELCGVSELERSVNTDGRKPRLSCSDCVKNVARRKVEVRRVPITRATC